MLILPKGDVVAHRGHPAVPVAVNQEVDRVHTHGRDPFERVPGDVGGRKADRPAPGQTVNHDSAGLVPVAQELVSVFHPALVNQVADPAGANLCAPGFLFFNRHHVKTAGRVPRQAVHRGDVLFAIGVVKTGHHRHRVHPD